jgi:putative oxidoreductase
MTANASAPYAALLLRVSLGVVFVAHGLILKVFVFTMPGTVGFFESLGYPGWFAWLTMIAETGGGLLLIAGVLTRLAALGLIPTLIGALLVHASNGWVFSAEQGGWEYPAFLIVVALAVALLGSGAHALRLPWPAGRIARLAAAAS